MSSTARSAYVFFGRTVLVESDAPDVVAVLDRVYERQLRFIGEDAAAEPRTDDPVPVTDVTVRVCEGGVGGPRIEVGGRTVRVPAADQLAHYAHLVLVNVAAAGVEDSVVLHAGAVARNGRATVLVGGSGYGKSTLTLELVRRGWQLLSDDFAMVRPDGVVDPFPRRVNLTESSLALLGLSPPPGAVTVSGFAGSPKWMIDIDELLPDRIGGPEPLGSIFLLSGRPTASTEGMPSPSERVAANPTWRLEVDHVPEGLEPTLAAIPGVRSVSVRFSEASAPVVKLTLEPGARIVPALDAACAKHDVAILSATRGAAAAPSFDQPPAASQLGPTEARTELMAHALSLSGRRFFEGTHPGAVLAAYSVIGTILDVSGAGVFRLWPGPLAATADLVERLARA